MAFTNALFQQAKKLKSFIFWTLLLVQGAVAQSGFLVRGNVSDEEGKPMAGVAVMFKSEKGGTTTDDEGNFSIRVRNSGATIIISSIGYETRTVRVFEKTPVSVVMQRVSTNQDEVVVIGYGSARRKDVTGAISTFRPKDGDGQQFNSVDQLLRGRMAGVQVQQSAGDPGGAVSVKIRGVNSLRGDNEPLYVVDGVIINSVTMDSGDPFSKKTSNSGQTRQNGLNGINPQDIERIEILKDASATAIYGSRGANGVVIVTTRQGRGRPVIRYSNFLEASTASKRLTMLGAQDYARYINETEALVGRAPMYGLDTLQEINWQEEMQRTGISSNNRLSITGSSADNKTRYFLAGGYLNTEGIVRRSGLQQGDLKMNLSQELTKRLRMNFTLSGVFTKNNMNQATEALGGGDNSMIMKMLVARPIANAQTDPDDPSIPYDNPYSWLEDYDDLSEEKRLLTGLGFTYRIAEGLSYKMNLAADYRNKERKRWFGKKTFNGKNANGQLGLSQLERKFYQIEHLLNLNKKVYQDHQLDATLGVTYDNETVLNASVINENFFSEALRTDGFGFGQVLYPYYRDKYESSVFSVLGRINYSIKGKYIFTISGRSDGSSKFADGNKFSYFPALAAAWKVSDESFLRNSKVISNLKIRAGYGRSGNQAISAYNTYARYGQIYYVNGNNLVSGAVPENLQNDRLKWETTNQLNAGVDISFFKDRISATLDWYHKQTDDLLQTFTLAPSAGFQNIVKNIGSIQNSGFEFSLSSLLVSRKNFTWTAEANISINRNKLLDLGLPNSSIGIYKDLEYYIGPGVSNGTYFKDPANIFIVGYPIGMLYGYQTSGLWNTGDNISAVKQFGLPVQPGDMKFIDQNGDGDIGPADKVILGNPNPDFTFGFRTGMTYKNLTFDIFLNGSYGNDVVNGNLIRIGNANGVNFNNLLAPYYLQAWTPSKAGAVYPRVGYNNLNFVDRYVEDASFLRVSTVSLGYNFSIKRDMAIKSVQLNLTGKNLFTLTNYSGFDPEVNSFSFNSGKIGVDWGSYPNLRSLSMGISLTF